MAHQTSRLHRLLTLLDTGSTMSTRRTAARQIGEIAKQHQGELQSLLQPVRHYLRSKSWDTRVAAAHAIGAIAENVMHLTVHDLLEVETTKGGHPISLQDLLIAHESNEIENCGGRALTFESFDIQAVLDFGALLLSSGGHEYDVGDDIAKSPTERLLRQKQSLRRRLGLDGCEQFMDVNDMIHDDDLLVHRTASTESGELAGTHNSQFEVNKQEVQELVANMVSGGLSRTLSARERNVFKRKAKVIPKDVVKEWGEEEVEEPMAKRAKDVKSVVTERMQGEKDKLVLDVVSDDYIQEGVNNGDWPFGHVVELLVHDMFDPVWEVRHGSLMALREILRVQAASAGVAGPLPKVETDFSRLPNDDNKEFKNGILSASARKGCMLDLNVNMLSQEDYRDFKKPKDDSLPAPQSQVGIKHPESIQVKAAKKAWDSNICFLQDCTIRLLCVFALDRFGDYVSDQVVAPVRETCAQVLGAVLKQMPSRLVHKTLSILLQMQSCSEWEVRHGSMLGIKYLVAVRQEMLQELLQRVLPACMAGLKDADDDVRAVAAEALTPAASTIVRDAGAKHVTSILLSLWDILLNLDDLSPSTSSVMHLLAELYSQPELDSRTVVEKPLLLDLNQTSMEDLSGGGRGVGGPADTSSFLSNLAPRLWLFMRHNIATVRLAAIRTLERLLQSGDNKGHEGSTGISWVVPILGDALRMVFQNLLLDCDENVLQCSQRVWRLLLQSPEAALAEEAGLYFSSWLNLASTATGASLETSNLYSPNLLPRRTSDRTIAKCTAGLSLTSAGGESSCHAPSRVNKIREHTIVVVGADGEKSVVVMRVVTAHCLGILSASLPSTKFSFIVKLLSTFLSSSSAIQRQVASMVIVSWFKEIRSRSDKAKSTDARTAAQHLLHQVLELLACGDPASPTPGSNVPYSELIRMYAKMRGEAGTLKKHIECIGGFQTSPVNLPSIDTISAEAAVDFTTKLSPQCRSQNGDYNMPMTSFETMELSRQQLLATAGYLQVFQSNLHLSVLASLAGAVVWMGELPIKLNPIIQPLMSAIKREQEDALQQPAAEALAEVIVQCLGRKPSPNEKLIRNLCCLVCADPLETPKANQANQSAVNAQEIDVPNAGRGIKNLKMSSLSVVDERARFEGAITRRGAESTLRSLSEKFKSSLFDQLPKLWDCLTEALGEPSTAAIGASQPPDSCSVWTSDSQALITNLQVVRSIAPVVDRKLHCKLLSLLPAILTCVKHEQAAVRLAASRCITSMAQIITEPVMALVLKTVIPMLGNSLSTEARQGAGILITALVEGLGPELVAYAPLLVIPLLGCMSDPNCLVRQSVTKSFAALVPLLPLARGVPPPKGLDECQASKNAEDTRFLEQLLDNSQVDDYKLCVPVNVTLRRYQQEGINWLAFLKRFKLHGILCDDMGLGKTLQASAIVASDTAERANTFAKSGSPDVPPLPSLVVCPSTLVAHWAYEIEKFIPSDVLNPLQYVGSPQERLNLQVQFTAHNIILTSYDILRKDINFLSQQVWNYCILDEGHIIKSSKSKITLAAKQIQADHRLILSGTPIQNNVLELWSLFDFLMPGFLGTERQFQSNYGKPLLAAREGKCTAKEAEAGVLAMEALHKQVMPFILRRTKDKVLADLPPKIIQDRYCKLSPLQLRLYEDFSRSQAKKEVSTLLQTYSELQVIKGCATSNAPSTHVFQALQYLRKLCSHPLLVLDDEAQSTLLSHTIAQSSIKDLHDVQHAPKLQALREILEECGIGTPPLVAAETPLVAEGGQHRVLVFAQLKSFLDIIEKDLLQTHMKGVTYLRLDGSVEAEKRFDIVKSFNSDPTIDVLLLTTHVGGLGLNLTAADTVVFMEHDWNPMRDLQAMDRAHRLGQRRAVNVHRLIMHGTLEEKIMSLQRFKLSVANTIINAENSSLNTMDTTQLLDLFTVSGNPRKAGTTRESRDDDASDSEASTSVGANKGLKAILNNLEELWDQSQYTEEYNLSQFVERLNSSVQ